MTQPIEKNGAGDGARTRDLRRDRPEGPQAISSACSENKAPECAGLSERDARKIIQDLIECAEIIAAQCRVKGDNAHALMWQARANNGRSLLSSPILSERGR